MRVRYRKLARSFDLDGYVSAISAAGDEASKQPHLSARSRGSAQTAAELGAAVGGLVSTPSRVFAEEGEDELEAVQEMLAGGLLAPTDLVNLGGGWQTFEDCVPFADQCDTYRRLPASRRRPRRVGGEGSPGEERTPEPLQFELRHWSWVLLFVILAVVLVQVLGVPPLFGLAMLALIAASTLADRSFKLALGERASRMPGLLSLAGVVVAGVVFNLFVLGRVGGVAYYLLAGLLGVLASTPAFLLGSRLRR
jgi:hypothetical protein